jgi:hypothetical protein
MVSRRGILGAGGGGFGAGLLLLAGGLIVKHSQAKMLAVCSSGPGRFGQALDPSTARQCGSAQDLSSMATGAIWIGAFLLVIAVGACIAFFARAGVTASKKPKVVVPAGGVARSAGPGRGVPSPSRAGEGAVLRPVVPVVVGQPVAAAQADGLPGPGCGHEVDDGARFCTVCGIPAVGGRDVFAAKQPVSMTGSEITTVLPVFAPPEPVGVPAPARAPVRSAERSMVGVGPGSQLGWADRPPAPGGVDASPPLGWAGAPPAAGAVKPGAPWEQAGASPAPGAVNSEPPWERGGGSPAAGAVASRPPWEQAGASPAPGAVKSESARGQAGGSPAADAVNSQRPWEQAGGSAAASAVPSGPPWEQAGASPAPGAVTSRPPWEQAGASPAPGAVKPGPPWGWAEPSPAPAGTRPSPKDIIPRQSGSGRHRSRRP